MVQGGNAALAAGEERQALQVSWEPANPGRGSYYRTQRLVECGPDRLEFRPALAAFTVSLIVLTWGLVFTAAGLTVLYSKGDWDGPVMAALGAVGLVLGLAIAWAANTPARVFDRRERLYWRGRKPLPTPPVDTDTCCRFASVRAVQILRERVPLYRRMVSYELNLILHGGQRIHVVDHGDLAALRADAARVAALIGCKVWDGTGAFTAEAARTQRSRSGFGLVFGLVLAGFAAMFWLISAPIEKARLERVASLSPIALDALRTAPLKSVVLLEGALSPANPGQSGTSLVAYDRRVQVQGERRSGSRTSTRYSPRMEPGPRPALTLDVPGGSVRLRAGGYRLDSPPATHEQSSLIELRGFRAGDPAMVVGTMVATGDVPELAAEFIYGGSRRDYLRDRERARVLVPLICAAVLATGIGIVALSLRSRRKARILTGPPPATFVMVDAPLPAPGAWSLRFKPILYLLAFLVAASVLGLTVKLVLDRAGEKVAAPPASAPAPARAPTPATRATPVIARPPVPGANLLGDTVLEMGEGGLGWRMREGPAVSSGYRGPGWITASRYAIAPGRTYILRVGAVSPEGGYASIGATYYDAQGRFITGNSCGCASATVPQGTLKPLRLVVGTAIVPAATHVELELINCLGYLGEDSPPAGVFFDKVFFGIEDHGVSCAELPPQGIPGAAAAPARRRPPGVGD